MIPILPPTMIQSSDLDRKSQNHSPNEPKTKHRALDHITAVPNLNHIYSPEISPNDTSEDGNSYRKFP